MCFFPYLTNDKFKNNNNDNRVRRHFIQPEIKLKYIIFALWVVMPGYFSRYCLWKKNIDTIFYYIKIKAIYKAIKLHNISFLINYIAIRNSNFS